MVTSKPIKICFCPLPTKLSDDHAAKNISRAYILIGFEVTILSNLRKVILRGQPFGCVSYNSPDDWFQHY